MNKSFLVALGIIGAIVVVVAILVSGGGPPAQGEEPAGDVAIHGGPRPPEDTSLADIVGAEVRRDESTIVFEVTMVEAIPNEVPDGSLEFRWDLSEGGRDTWIVQANVNIDRPTAAVTSQKTSYGSSTIDGTMPGTVEVDGETLTVTIRADEIEGFPTAFQWLLETTLDADRANPRSGVATDTAPDSGPGEVEG